MHRFTPHIIYQKSKVDVVAIIAFVISTLLQVIAVATPGWARTPEVLVGLFHYCGKLALDYRTPSMRECEYLPLMNTIDTLQAVQVLSVLSVCLAGVSTLLFVLHMWMITQYEKITATVIILCMSVAVLSIVCCIVCIAVFGASTRHYFPTLDQAEGYQIYYSFAMFVAGGGILLLVVILVIARVRTLTRMLLV